jgi:hypothetical protein
MNSSAGDALMGSDKVVPNKRRKMIFTNIVILFYKRRKMIFTNIVILFYFITQQIKSYFILPLYYCDIVDLLHF